MSYRRHALRLLEMGWSPIPLNGKIPTLKGWQEHCLFHPFRHQIETINWSHWDGNVGICCGPVSNTIAVDVDIDDTSKIGRIEQAIEKYLGPTPLKRYGRYPRFLLLYQCLQEYRNRTHPVDFRRDKTQFAAFGRHPNGNEYRWEDLTPLEVRPEDLPTVKKSSISALQQALGENMTPGTGQKGNVGFEAQFDSSVMTDERLKTFGQSRYRTIARHLRDVKPGNRHNTLVSSTAALASLGMTYEEIEHFIECHFNVPKHDRKDKLQDGNASIWAHVPEAIRGAIEKFGRKE